MSCEGVKLFSEKVHGPCWGLFQKWKSSWMITVNTKKEHYSNFCTFEIASLVNVPGHYLRR